MEGLLSPEDDCSLLLSQFQEYLEHDDIRYHTMRAATDVVGRVADRYPEVSRLGPVAGDGWAVAMPVLRLGFLQVPLTFWNNAFTLLSAVSLPRRERSSSNFYVKHVGERPGQAVGQGHPVGCVLSRVPANPSLLCRADAHVEGASSEGEMLRRGWWPPWEGGPFRRRHACGTGRELAAPCLA